ncbi:hypothetical protein Nmel_010255 [Mimus melanotis]
MPRPTVPREHWGSRRPVRPTIPSTLRGARAGRGRGAAQCMLAAVVVPESGAAPESPCRRERERCGRCCLSKGSCRWKTRSPWCCASPRSCPSSRCRWRSWRSCRGRRWRRPGRPRRPRRRPRGPRRPGSSAGRVAPGRTLIGGTPV